MADPAIHDISATAAQEARVQGRSRFIDRILNRFAHSSISFEIRVPGRPSQELRRRPAELHRHLARPPGPARLRQHGRGPDRRCLCRRDISTSTATCCAPSSFAARWRTGTTAVAAWRFLAAAAVRPGADQSARDRRPLRHRLRTSSWRFLDPDASGLHAGRLRARRTRRLADATRRKFDYCFEKLGLKPGDRILEIGPGWGAWFEYAAQARREMHRHHHLEGIDRLSAAPGDAARPRLGSDRLPISWPTRRRKSTTRSSSWA